MHPTSQGPRRSSPGAGMREVSAWVVASRDGVLRPRPAPGLTQATKGHMQAAFDVKAVNELVAQESGFVDQIVAEVGKVIIGQRYMVERMLIGLLTGGHVLLEGVPGLAKTLTVKTMADTLRA